MLGLQELDEGVTRLESSDARAVCVIERGFPKAKDVAVEGEYLSQVADRDADVGDTGATAGRFLHKFV